FLDDDFRHLSLVVLAPPGRAAAFPEVLVGALVELVPHGVSALRNGLEFVKPLGPGGLDVLEGVETVGRVVVQDAVQRHKAGQGRGRGGGAPEQLLRGLAADRALEPHRADVEDHAQDDPDQDEGQDEAEHGLLRKQERTTEAQRAQRKHRAQRGTQETNLTQVLPLFSSSSAFCLLCVLCASVVRNPRSLYQTEVVGKTTVAIIRPALRGPPGERRACAPRRSRADSAAGCYGRDPVLVRLRPRAGPAGGAVGVAAGPAAEPGPGA